MIHKQEVKETFHFELTEAEKIAYAAKMAVAIREKDELEAESKASKKEFKLNIESKEGEIYRLAQAINHGEDRVVKCVKEIEGDVVRFILNGKVLKERKRSEGEGPLELDDPRGGMSEDMFI